MSTMDSISYWNNTFFCLPARNLFEKLSSVTQYEEEALSQCNKSMHIKNSQI
jgi:hypothetical protein